MGLAGIVVVDRLTVLSPELLARKILLAVHDDVELAGGDTRSAHRRKFQRSADVQVGDCPLQQLERNSGVEQRTQEHVAADAGETIEIGNAHGSRSKPAENFIIGNA